jgi:hypothetical protein
VRFTRRSTKPKPLSRRPRLRRLRWWSVRIAAAVLAVWALSLLTGYELLWARGHEAAVFSRGSVVYYRSGYDYVYFLHRSSTAGNGKWIRWDPTLADGLGGSTLSQLSWASATNRQSMPSYYPDGFAINAAPSIEPQAEMFLLRNDLWRTRLPLWWAALAAMVPWGLAVARLRVRLPLARWRLARHHRCRFCGYSITGLPPGARCPECGETPRAGPAVH